MRTLGACLVGAALLVPSLARAQADRTAVALSLFEEGKRLAAEGKYADACPKLLTSYNLVQKVGTLLNLADCYEKNGQTASAWARFSEAIGLAERAGEGERVEFAKQHQSGFSLARSPSMSRRVRAAAGA